MKTIARLTAVTAAGCLALTACGDGTADGEDSYSWDFTITTSETSTWYEAAEHFADVLDERSDGRMQVTVHANEQLSGGDPAAGVEQLMNGDKAFSYNSTIIYDGLDSRFSAINAPFLYDDYEQAEATIEASAGAAYEEISRELGVEMLGFGESGFRQLTTTDTEVTSPDDLTNLVVRVPGSGLFLDIFNELGADPTTMNFAEVYTSLQTGTIDGQENPFDVIYSSGLQEVQGHLSIWNYVYDPLILGMNAELFDSLSAEDQQIVQEAATEANELQISQNREREAEQLEELSEDMEITELSEAQIQVFRDAMEPVYDAHADSWTEELLDAVQPE
ncbi:MULTISPECIES: DctP family TRAP transporter solute-binding subunit [unclassified Nesterenkonia]|uniref:DctP family TRAP transporter solute-binding subunit n=1 Tax=unclassified Nesterenkonia TaxID=2629769 RepID=UPI000872E0C7|nr:MULTISPECIES: DctP family TRAP transporter solute-binding subunit [unclassified Nesterenkonia]MDS2173744.1 DctP family TRAP transporter solute-binding subunit [Nesterenkonia sp. CL21]OSM44348.1 C4-dicarboxylate ABC transporter substrate-binding protein [Nesterenkonia sp. PF2B19]